MSKVNKTSSITTISLILVLGALAPLLDSTMVNIAINNMTRNFHTTLSSMQWAITGYTLTMGIMVPIAGWATDRFSGRILYIVASLGFFLGSLLSALSTNFTLLLIGRLFQGAAAGFIMTSLSTLVVRAANGKSLGSLMATLGLPIMICPILGPVVGAFLVNNWNWHIIFWINVPITLITIALSWFFLPILQGPEPKKKFDWIGISLLAVMFACSIIGISNVKSQTGFTPSNVWGPLVLAGISLIAYIIYASFASHPIFALDVFKSHNFSASIVLVTIAGIAINGPMMLLPLYFQNIRGVSLITTGLLMMPQALGMLITRSMAGKLTDSMGPRPVVLTGLLITIAATYPLISINANTANLYLLVVLFIRGIGLGIYFVPVMSAAYIGLPTTRAGEVSVITRLMQNIGGSIGTSILAVVVANNMLNSHYHTTITIASHAYNAGFFISFVMTIVALIPVFFLSAKTKKD